MNSTTVRRYGTPTRDDDRRTIAWLAGIALLVSLLTSEAIWGQVLNFLGAEENDYAEQGRGEAFVPDAEMKKLIELTGDNATLPQYAPERAIELNQAIPFAAAPIVSARPFHPVGVGEVARMTALKCLTQAVYYEAGFEPIAGRRAVAQVVLNRAAHPAFPKSVCGVVYQGVNRPVCQFSFTCDGSLNRAPNPRAWKEAEEVASAALGGYVDPNVGYSTHYHANYVSPYWAPKLVKITQIGAHIFYRWPGRWGTPGAFSGQYSGAEAIPAILPRGAVAKTGPAGGGGLVKASAGDDGLAALEDRRAENDAGGRLETGKGWELVLPPVEETSRSARMMAQQQSGEYDINSAGNGS